jgi:hypothetical protein
MGDIAGAGPRACLSERAATGSPLHVSGVILPRALDIGLNGLYTES